MRTEIPLLVRLHFLAGILSYVITDRHYSCTGISSEGYQGQGYVQKVSLSSLKLRALRVI